jgi:hypothetical protein
MVPNKRQIKIASAIAQVYYTAVILLMFSSIFWEDTDGLIVIHMSFIVGVIGVYTSAGLSLISGILWFFKIGIPFQKTTIRYHLTYVVLFIGFTLMIMKYYYKEF